MVTRHWHDDELYTDEECPCGNPFIGPTVSVAPRREEQATSKVQGRVEFRAAGEHSIGNRESFVVVSKQATHAETWAITECDVPPGEEAFKDKRNKFLLNMGVQDREGNWFIVWHNFHPTNELADEWLAKEVEAHLACYNNDNCWVLLL